jgi:hypothetical protein
VKWIWVPLPIGAISRKLIVSRPGLIEFSLL